MKDSRPFPLSQTLVAVITTALWLSFSASQVNAATNDTWTGGGAPDGNWQNAANWGGTAPSAFDALFFDGAVQTSTTNNFAAGTIFGNLSFTASADAFSLYGNSLTLTNGTDAGGGAVYGGGITNSSINTETVNNPITLSPGRHNIVTEGGGQLNLAGQISRSSGALVQFLQTAGTINGTGGLTTNGFNNILGAWAIIGTDWATLDANSNVVAYTDYTDVSGAPAIANNPASNVRWSGDSGNATAANGTTINSLVPQIGSARNLNIASGGVLKLGSRGGIYRSTFAGNTLTVQPASGTAFLTANGGGEITLVAQPGTTSGNIIITALITNDGPVNPVSVNVFGYVNVNGVFNRYTGGTYISQGRFSGNNAGSFGTGPVYVYPGGQAFFGGNVTWTNDFYLSGIGSTETSGGQVLGALRFSTGTSAVSGIVTLMSDTRIAGGSGGANSLTGKITGPGRLEFTAATGSSGSITLSGAGNDWSGGLLLTSAGNATRNVFLRLGANNQIPDGPGKGDVVLNGAVSTVRLDLNGFSDTINGLSAAPSVNNQIANFSSPGAPSTLTVGGNNATATYGGTISDNGGVTNLSIVKTGAGTQTFTGVNTYRGSTTVNGGTLSFGGGAFPASSPIIGVNSNATLDLVAVCPLTLSGGTALVMTNGIVSVVPQSVGNAITTPTLTVGGDTNRVAVNSIPAIASYPAQFTLIKCTTLNGTLNFGLSGSMPPSPGLPYAGFISNNTANGSVDLVITSGPASFKWTGYSSGAPNSAWDIGTTANWRTLGGTPTTYTDFSFVLFDDFSSNGVVTLNQAVSPAGITVTNSTLAYTINDLGGLGMGGLGSLSKQGSGTLILDNTGANTFSGGVTISAGTLQVGNNDFGGSLPATGAVANNGTLIFARADDVVVSNSISGGGTITQNGTASLMLAGISTFTGPATVTQGTLKIGNNAALGATNGATIIANGATLDVTANAINLGQEPITASGAGVGAAGAIVNSSGSPTFANPSMARLTLAGNTTIGGSGRWDLRSSNTGNPTLASLLTGGNAYKLTKVGGNQISIVGVTVDDKLGDIDVQAGILSIETTTTGLGNIASNLTVASGATLQFFAPTNLLNKNFIINDGATILNNSGSSTVIGPMAFTNSSLSPTPYCTVNVGGTSLTLSNVLTGDGIIYKVTGANPLTISGNSPSFAGGVYVNVGNLTLSGTLSNALGVTMVGGTRLILTGSLLGGALTNNLNSTLIASGTSSCLADLAGNVSLGDTGVPVTFTVGGMVVESSAILTNDLSSYPVVGGGTNDLIVVNGDLIMNGGTIIINPLGLLPTGVPYRLFNYSGSLVTNALPVISAPNNYVFAYDFSTTNQVNIIASGGPPVWNGGSATVSMWTDPANWNATAVNPGDSVYFAGGARINNTNDTAALTSYTDIVFVPAAAQFVLNGNPVTLNGNVVNDSTNAETVNLGLNVPSNRTLNGANGNLIIGGGVTNTANTTITLAGSGTLTNLLGAADPTSMTNIFSVISNANWTLLDNASATPITTPVQLDMLAGTFNFGTPGNAPNLSSTANNNNSRLGVTANAPATFNMVNGTLTLSARLNTGTAGNSIATLNQSGGTINCQLFQNADGSSAASSTVNITGGTFNVGVPTRASFFVSSRGTGVVTVATSGTINCGTLDVSRGISSSTPSVVNLNGGGTISATRVGTASSASVGTSTGNTATFNFNGGTLVAAASSTTYFQGNTSSPAIPITAIVKSGGAIIDTTNFNITIAEPLTHDSTLGSTPDGGLLKQGTGRMTMTSFSTYTGVTIVTNGNLAINGSLGLTPVIVASNATLSGFGICGSNVTVQLGGTIAPGASAGVLTVSNSVTLLGAALMEIQKSPSVTNDRVRSVNATINYGGALVVTNIGGVLVGGESFKLFDSGISSYGGSFGSIQLPPLGAGLSWNTTQLPVSGTISVSGTIIPPTITSVIQSGLTLTSSGNNGIPNGQYVVLSATNVVQGMATWARVQTNSFDGSGNFTFTVPVNPAGPNQFYRVQLQ